MKEGLEINGHVFNDMEYVIQEDIAQEEIAIYNAGVSEPKRAGKNDVIDGKADMSLLPEVFLIQTARAMMAGEKKYGTFNYLKGHKIRQLTSAICRHAKKIEGGEWWDSDTTGCIGQPVSHLACIAANVLMALHQDEEGTLIDNTFKGISK